MAATPYEQVQKLRPQAGPQYDFLTSEADIVVYGGSAGGGKSFALLLDPLRHIDVPGFGAVIFRRTSEEIRMEGGLWDEALNIYPLLGAKSRELQLDFRFRSGASITLDSIQHEQDKLRFQGSQICAMGFDELTHFTESMFFYMLSRNRSTCGVRPTIRATTNPDANSWVKSFLAPWLNKDHSNPAASGEVRWFVRDGGKILWVPEGTVDAKSVTFIRARVFDNKILLERDPGYLANLKALSLVDRRRLLDGDWDVVEGGNMFQSSWWRITASPPPCIRWVRFWDLAATEVKAGKDPDWTVGVKMGLTAEGIKVIDDVRRFRESPHQSERMIRQTAEADGVGVPVCIEEEGGSSGKFVTSTMARTVLQGFESHGIRSSGSKADRAKPYSADVEKGHVLMIPAPWNHDFINEHSPFPTEGIHDDQVDAASGAFKYLTRGVVRKDIPRPSRATYSFV